MQSNQSKPAARFDLTPSASPADTEPTSSVQTNRHGRPSLPTGDAPFLNDPFLTCKASTSASFDIVELDADHESVHVVGYFDVPICWS
jgi:hypothetical protein